jgi:hypothetical protein
MIAMAIIVALGGMSTSIQSGFLGILRRAWAALPARPARHQRLAEQRGRQRLPGGAPAPDRGCVGPVSSFRYATTIADVSPDQ